MAGFYSSLFTKLSGTLDTYVNSTSASIIEAITPVARTLVLIYICLWGWSMIRGVIEEPITDAVSRLVRLSIIVAIATTGGYYATYLSDWIWNSPDAMASYIAGDSGVTNVNFLDTLWIKVYDYGVVYFAKAKADRMGFMPDFTLALAGAGIWGAGVLATGYAAFLLVLSKIALAILLGIGPLFVLLLIFEPTKQFFNAWLGQALNYVILTMLTAAAIKLIFTLLDAYLPATAPVDPSLSDAISAIALFGIAFLVLLQLPSQASALGGGVAVSTLGAVGSLYRRLKGATGAGVRTGKSLKNLVTGKTLSNMRGARRTREVNRRWAERTAASRAAAREAGAPSAVYRKVTTSRANRVQKA
jgi:type IV secretion system protein VirB6